MLLLCTCLRVYTNDNGSLPADGSRLIAWSPFLLLFSFLKVSLCFSRDPYVCHQLCSKFGSRAQTTARFAPASDITSSNSGVNRNSGTSKADGDAIGGQSAVTSAFPPSSCIPFYGWAMYGTFGYDVRKRQRHRHVQSTSKLAEKINKSVHILARVRKCVKTERNNDDALDKS